MYNVSAHAFAASEKHDECIKKLPLFFLLKFAIKIGVLKKTAKDVQFA